MSNSPEAVLRNDANRSSAFKRIDERPGPYEETHCDETVQGKLIAAIAEDMAQTFPVAPRGRGQTPKIRQSGFLSRTASTTLR